MRGTGLAASGSRTICPALQTLRVRLLLAVGLCAPMAAAAVTSWWVAATPPEFYGRITGPSMAPTLLGPHWSNQCQDCGFSFASDAPQSAYCPNCRGGRLGEPVAVDGQRVTVRSGSRTTGWPDRWQVVAVRGPDGTLRAKRVIGLPGERVKLSAGDVWIDQEQAVRSPEQLQEMFVLVHDERYRSVTSDRRITPGWYPVAGASEPDGTGDWMWQEFLPQGRDGLRTVTDDYPYNTQESRQLHAVHDGALVMSLDAAAAASPWALQRGWEGEWWTVLGDPDRQRIQVWRNSSLVRQIEDASNMTPLRVAWFFADGRQFLIVQNQTVWEDSDVPMPPGTDEGRARWRRASRSGNPPLSGTQVWRDLYYYCPATYGSDCLFQLQSDQLFVVGDNVPVSWDSRQEGLPVRVSDVVGEVGGDRIDRMGLGQDCLDTVGQGNH